MKINGHNTSVLPTFKANVRSIQVGHGYKTTISDVAVNDIEKLFKQIGDNKDCFEHVYLPQKSKTFHYFEYYREGNKEKRFRYVLNDDNYLTPLQAVKILTKSIIEKEPITSQDTTKITREVQFPEATSFSNKKFDIKYSKQYSQGEDNFYYKNGKKAVCVQNITPNKDVAEYYDKNGNLKFKKYRNLDTFLIEKYNNDGQISYKIIMNNSISDFPVVIKDDKMFQMHAYQTYSPDSMPGHIATPDYRVLIERNNDKSLRYYLDTSIVGIRPQDAPSHEYYSLDCVNKHAERMNQEYAKKLIEKNPVYTPEHLKELYFFPHKFNEEFIEDNTIFNTNYRINLIGSNLKPNTENNYETITTVSRANPRYIERLELPKKYNIFSQFKFFDEIWDDTIELLQYLLNS